MSENKDKGKDEEEGDPDIYIRTIASTWGHIDLIKDWLPHHRHEPDRVTYNVLFPAAMYGLLDVLQLALKYGNVAMRDESPSYPGWSLLHFAVEGAQRIIPLSNMDDCHPPALCPRTVEDIHAVQLDIIYLLIQAGADPTAVDVQGHSASYRACHELEDVFLEGAILIDSVVLEKRGEVSPPPETPGLSCIPSQKGWKDSVHQLMQWAYTRHHYEILRFCHLNRFISLYSPMLKIKSNTSNLRVSHRPLAIDAMYEEDFTMLEIILGLPDTPNNFLSVVYEYDHGQAKDKESVMSLACRRHMDGSKRLLRRILTMDIQSKFLTSITLSGLGLRRIPVDIFHVNLLSLDIRENNLNEYPCAHLTDQNYLGWNCPMLETLNFSNNFFTYIHPDIFSLPSLFRLLMNGNVIQEVPAQMWTAPHLNTLELSNNLILDLPCPPRVHRTCSGNPFLFGYRTMSLHRRRNEAMVDGGEVCLQSLRKSSINYNSRSIHRVSVNFVLHMLDLSGNHLTSVPRGLACLAPLLRTLKLSKNRITSMGTVYDYPSFLQSLDLSDNGLTRGVDPPPIITASNTVNCIQSQLVTKQHPSCLHQQHVNFSCLKYLYLGNNSIADLVLEYESEANSEHSDTYSEFDLLKNASVSSQLVLFFPNLQGLRISNNSLTRIPENIHKLTKLRELVVSHNELISALPPLLHRLTSLFVFRHEGIADPIVQELAHFKNTAEILYYLKARGMSCVSNTSMRLLVIGHYSKGKTTLLSSLMGCSSKRSGSFDARFRRIGNRTETLNPTELNSTVGIECGKWQCNSLSSRHSLPINFYTWDFAGQEEYYVTHQCFLTNRALYLLVWNVLDGDAGVQSLSIWLQNLQSKAQGYPHTVIIVGTHIDKIHKNEKDRMVRIWKDKLEKFRIGRRASKAFPSIVALHFVGCPPRTRNFIGIDSLNDVIYNIATNMESHRDPCVCSLKVKVLEEKIPLSYDQLRRFIESYRGKSPAIHKDAFCELVRDIIDDEAEVKAAVDYLHATTGVILHFNIVLIKDYYIVDPQRWFDLCALVISPDNVSTLVRVGRPGDEKFGLLSSAKMSAEFLQRGLDKNTSKLVRTFLSQFNIIHPVNREYCLIPSAIHADPTLQMDEMIGSFPHSQQDHESLSSPYTERLPSIDAMVCNTATSNVMTVKKTGLIYRRMILLPPIPSGFWSKLIALFLQKPDFPQIINSAIPGEHATTPIGPAHRLCCLIGELEMRWMYWKAGIILYFGEAVVMEVHSLMGNEFEDPHSPRSKEPNDDVFRQRRQKLKSFCFAEGTGWRFIPSHYTDVIEIIIPEISIVDNQLAPSSMPNSPPLVSSQLLVKALEIVDEVLKSHCEQFGSMGIYSLSDMLHVIPCPLEYGDIDKRVYDLPVNVGLMNMTDGNIGDIDDVVNLLPEENGLSDAHGSAKPTPRLPDDCICVFTINSCIQSTLGSESITCPKCGPLDLQSLAPDLVFADIAHFKLNKEQLDHLVDKRDDAVAAGGFGTVFKRILHTNNEGDMIVAVKVFDRADMGLNLPVGHVELIRSYSDMRYELNKLCTLKHPNIVNFIGVFTNPHCFVLEWAPLLSLEHQRIKHEEAEFAMCCSSILSVLHQVTGALSYLHSYVGIVHRDLRSSNILVFDFPPIGHFCFREGRERDCFVLVKIADMGISANPLGRKAGSFEGLKLLVPECIAREANKLTEKVDIFTLGSCLYEMLTLTRLPPRMISEPEYKNMLLSRKRPFISAKDVVYPPLFTQTLEECWEHEHFKRPSAENIHKVISCHLRLDANHASQQSGNERPSILLDSFVLHPVNWISASHCSNLGGTGFEICAALCGQEGLLDQGLGQSIVLASVMYNSENEKSEMELGHTERSWESPVVSVHITLEAEIFVGCADGTIFFFDKDGNKTRLDRDCNYSQYHGDLIKVRYSSEAKVMVVAFGNGRIHLRKCTQSATSSLSWRESCLALQDVERTLHDMECLYVPGNGDDTSPDASHNSGATFEVWLGLDSDEIQVWSFSLSPEHVWFSDRVSQIQVLSCIRMSEESVIEGMERRECIVHFIKGSEDQSMVVCVLRTPRKPINRLCIFGVASKHCLWKMELDFSVSALLLTSSLLAIGSYEGKINVYKTASLLGSTSESTIVTEPRILHAHKNRVYDLHCLKGCVTTSGHTSLFPTFIGHSAEDVEKEFLISVGSGRGYPSLNKSIVFKNFVCQRGCFVNVWLV